MIRAVLDSNVMASALIRPAGPPGEIVTRLIRDETFQLILSPAIAEELRRCLKYPKVRRYIAASDREIDLWVSALEFVADTVEGSASVASVVADPDDDKYLGAALDGRAGVIVSGDRHLLDLREYDGVRILTPRAFLGILGQVR